MKLLVLQSPDNQSREISLQAGQNVAGRDPENALHLPSRRVSRKHCSFSVEDDRVFVRDLGSSNGVVVEGQRVREAELLNGQRVQVGDYLLQFVNDPVQKEAAPSFEPDPLSSSDNSPFGGPEAPESPFGEGAQDPFSVATKAVPLTKEPEAAPPPEDNPFAALDEDNEGGFGGGGFGGGGFGDSSFGGEGGFGSQNSGPAESAQPHGFGEPPAGSFSQNQGAGYAPLPQDNRYGDLPLAQPDSHSENDSLASEKLDVAKAQLGKIKSSLHRIPWAPKLGSLLLGCLLLAMLAPGGGILALLSRAESTMEQMSIEHAIQMARASARDNEQLIPVEGGRYELRKTTISALERVTGVTPGGAVIVDIRGDTKVPADKVGTQPDGVHELIKEAVATQTVAQRWHGSLLRVFAPIRFDANGPAQVVGGVYLEYEPTEFVNEVGQPSSLALVAFVVLGLIFAMIFTVTWRMTNQPIKMVREETELAVLGHQPLVNFETHWPEMEQLIHTINRVLRRTKPGGGNADQQLQSLVALAAWPVIITDGDLRLTAANPVAARILGGDLQKAIGQPLAQLVTHPELATKMRTLFSQLGGSNGKHGVDSVVMDGHQRKLSIAVGTSNATGKLEYAVVVIA